MRAQSDRTTYAAQYGSIYISVTVGLAGSCHFGAVGWWHAADRADRVRRAFCAAHLGEAGVCDPVRADSDVAPGLARVLPGGAPAAGRMRRRGGGGRGRADDLGDDPGVPDRRAAAPGRPGRPGPWPGPDRPDRADHPPGPDGGAVRPRVAKDLPPAAVAAAGRRPRLRRMAGDRRPSAR